jgi:hypothetical protein
MSDLAEAGPGAVAMHAINNARQHLMLPEPDLARVAELLAPVPDLILRQQTALERMEGVNTALCEQFADEQLQREALEEQGTMMLGEFLAWLAEVRKLRGRGTPRAIPRTATDNSPRFTTHPVARTAAPFASEFSTHIIGG